MTKNVTTKTFKEDVLDSKTPVLVDFWADWCGPCHKLSPILDEVIAELDGKVSLVKVDVDAEQEIAMTYKIMTIPTIFLFINGEIVYQSIGVKPRKVLLDEISKYL